MHWQKVEMMAPAVFKKLDHWAALASVVVVTTEGVVDRVVVVVVDRVVVVVVL
jgi:hypothetical protein